MKSISESIKEFKISEAKDVITVEVKDKAGNVISTFNGTDFIKNIRFYLGEIGRNASLQDAIKRYNTVNKSTGEGNVAKILIKGK